MMLVQSVIILSLICFNLETVQSQTQCNNRRVGEGNPRNKRNDNDAGVSGRHYLDCSYSFNCCGVITECEYYTEIAGTLQIQIWRPTATTGSYQLVGEYAHTGTANTEENANNIPTASQMTVRSGDCMGWYTDGEDMLTYKAENGGSPQIFQLPGLGDLPVGTIQDWTIASVTTLTLRKYAINCRANQGTAPSFNGGLPATIPVLDSLTIGTSVGAVTVADQNTFDVLTITMSNTYFTYDEINNYNGDIDVLTATLAGASGSTQNLGFTVTDDCGLTDTYSVSISVTNVPPVLAAMSSNNPLSEDTNNQVLVYTPVCTDIADDTSVTIAGVVPSTTPSPFTIVQDLPNAGDDSVYTSFTPNFDYDIEDIYVITVRCSDGKDSVTGELTVRIVPNQVPVINNVPSPTTVTIPTSTGNTVVVFTVTHDDVEADTVTYTLTCDPVGCDFDITSSGDIITTSPLTDVTQSFYNVEIGISDLKGTGIARSLAIEITDINDPPRLITFLPEVVNENVAIGHQLYDIDHIDTNTLDTIVYSMSSNPATDLFTIDTANGIVSVKNLINFEDLTNKVYTLTVGVTDGKASATTDLTVTVLNVNEAPSLNRDSYSVTTTEGQPKDTLLPDPPITITDPDDSDTYTCYLACGTTDFNINLLTCRISFANVYSLDIGKPSTVTCTLTVTDAAGLSDTAPFVINIEDVNSYTPYFYPTRYNYYFSEDEAVNTAVGTVTATDADANTFGNIVYTLNQSALSFPYYQINANTGVIALASSLIPCNCPLTTHNIFAVATDGGLLSSSTSVAITILDVTTTTSTTPAAAQDRFKTFFESTSSISWLIAVLLLLLVTFGTSMYICFRYVRGWPKNLCRKTIRIASFRIDETYPTQARGLNRRHRMQRFPRYERNFSPPPDRMERFDIQKNINSVRTHPPNPSLQGWKHTN